MLAYIALLPEFVLMSGVLLLLVSRLFKPNLAPKFVYGVCKLSLILSAFLVVVLYNRSIDGYFISNSYAVLFKIIVYLLSIGWSYLSLKHFYVKEKAAFRFYTLMLLEVFSLSLIISSNNIALLTFGLSLSFVFGYLMLWLDRRMNYIYLATILFFVLLLACSSYTIYHCFGVLDYSSLKDLVELNGNNPYLAFSFMAIMLSLFFAIGLAPLHLCFIDSIEEADLPSAGYINLVPLFAYFPVFVTLVSGPFAGFYVWFSALGVGFGVISVLFGAFGANSTESLRKIFAYAGLYYMGIIMICLNNISASSLLCSFIYLFTYVISMFGIYASFYGLKHKGEYLDSLSQIKSLASERPFLASSILIFIISLIGLPPLFGFVGQFFLFDHIADIEAYKTMVLAMLSLLILSCGYLKVLSSIYFEGANNKFDSVDRVIYFALSLNIFIILSLAISPQYLISYLIKILAGVL